MLANALRFIGRLLAAAAGLLLVADYFFDNPLVNDAGARLLDWIIVLAVFALIAAAASLIWRHLQLVIRSEDGWPYSLALLAVFALVVAAGLRPGSAGPEEPAVAWVFEYVYAPLSASLFALLAFFTISAAFRYLRATTLPAAIMLVSAVVVLLGQMPLTHQALLPAVGLADWTLDYPLMGAARAIAIGVSLGATIAGLRFLLTRSGGI